MQARTIHLHPSRFCNLECSHCYSLSGPQVREALDVDEVLPSLEVLREEGYQILSLSGGEPLLYGDVEVLLREAHGMGFQVNLVSNGSALVGRRLQWVDDYATSVALSLDGAPERHVAMRHHPKAFEWVESALQRLQDAAVNVGIAFCVSSASLPDMPWAVTFAREHGAGLVQFHPFSATGRAEGRTDLALSASDLARVYLVAKLLQTDAGPQIQLDLTPVAAALSQREQYAVLETDVTSHARLADVVNPLIIDETGEVVPFCYGVHSDFSIGRVGNDLRASVRSYKETKWQGVRRLIARSFQDLGERDETFVEWFDHVARTSREMEAA
jgi:MoaA/NifB/PqqE/SkfB family radical SAM enzyme